MPLYWASASFYSDALKKRLLEREDRDLPNLWSKAAMGTCAFLVPVGVKI